MNGRRTQTSSTPNSHRRCVVASDAAICSPASPHAGLPPPHGRWTFFGTAAGRSDGVLVMEIGLVAPGDHTRPALWDRRESQDRHGQVAPELAGGLRGSLFPRIWSTTDEVGLGFLLLNSCTMGQRILRVERRRGKVGGREGCSAWMAFCAHRIPYDILASSPRPTARCAGNLGIELCTCTTEYVGR